LSVLLLEERAFGIHEPDVELDMPREAVLSGRDEIRSLPTVVLAVGLVGDSRIAASIRDA
jgi:hypothetical protein